jgi:hypothetical protein
MSSASSTRCVAPRFFGAKGGPAAFARGRDEAPLRFPLVFGRRFMDVPRIS